MSGHVHKSIDMKSVFLQHLPERLITIERDWNSVKDSISDQGMMGRMLTRVQDMAGASGKVGLINISETAFSIESQLSRMLELADQPTPDQINHMDELIQALKHQVNQAIASQFSTSIGPGDKIAFYLRSGDDVVPGMTTSLEALGFSVLTFIHPDDVEGELQKRIPDILIFDGLFLDRMSSLRREIKLQEESNQRKIPTVCLSNTRELEKRLQALRSGIDAYLLQPFSSDKVIEKIKELTAPKEDAYRILIVEDDPSQAKFASSILEKGGMKAYSVTDPMQALDALNDFRPDLILMDLYMPGADGKELTTIIREHPDYLTTPIVFLSGEHDTDKKLHALSAGGDDFLTKPIRPKHLISTIANRVERAKALKAGPAGLSMSNGLNGTTGRHYFIEQIESRIAAAATQQVFGGVLYLTFQQQKKHQPSFTEQQVEALRSSLRILTAGLVTKDDLITEFENGVGILSIDQSAAALLKTASRIQGALRHHHFAIEGDDIKLNTSVGISLFDRDITNAAQMIDRAVVAAKEALKGGGEQILIFDHQISTNDQESPAHNIQLLLEAAIKDDAFEVIFQPLRSNKSIDHETSDLSLRLRHGRDILPKEQWQTVAVETGMIADIDRLALLQALSAIETKRREGRQVMLFVEQSFQSMKELSNIEWLRSQLRSRQMVGTGLVFEYPIAELGQDLKTAKSFINELKEMGVGISMSRFGANTAALRVLQFLQSEFVRLAPPILQMDQVAAEKLVREIHILGAKVLLPRPTHPKTPINQWMALADLYPDA